MSLVFKSLYLHRSILYTTVLEGVKGRTKANVLGMAWLLLYPLLFLGLYSLVYVNILRVRMPDMATTDYVLTIFAGLVPFLAFSEAFGIGTPSIVANRSLLRNTIFPIELIVARDVFIGHVTMGVGMLIVWVGAIYLGHIHVTHLIVPIVYIMQIMMTLGIVWISSTISVFFRDFIQATPIFILFLMMVSPIGYTDSMVPAGLKPLLWFNPLAILMKLYRSLLMDGVIPWVAMIELFVISLVILLLGHFMIVRLKPIFVDYV